MCGAEEAQVVLARAQALVEALTLRDDTTVGGEGEAETEAEGGVEAEAEAEAWAVEPRGPLATAPRSLSQWWL